MGTVLRIENPASRPGRPAPAGVRPRLRWRFRARGLIGLALLAVFAINLFVLADGLVHLIRLRHDQAELVQRKAKRIELNRGLQRNRDRVASDQYLREQASDLGYTEPGLSSAEDVEPPMIVSPIKRRRDKPSPPY